MLFYHIINPLHSFVVGLWAASSDFFFFILSLKLFNKHNSHHIIQFMIKVDE